MIGLFAPTHGRPDLIRSSLLQFTTQTVVPDLIAVHQNGDPENYRYIIEDVKWPFDIIWIYNSKRISQHKWYSVPLQKLIEANCDYYFWIDHDDIYKSNHIEVCINELKNYDFRVSKYSQQLTVDQQSYKFSKSFRFTAHAPGGQSSSMAFNKKFAECLLKDINEDHENHYTDNVVAKVTMPKFNCFQSEICTTTYMCHKGSTTSRGWVDNILKK